MMKINYIVWLLSLLMNGLVNAQSRTLPTEPYREIYKQLLSIDPSIDMIDEAMVGLPIDHPDRNFFDVLKIIYYTDANQWEEVDSLYNRLYHHFSKINNSVMQSKLFSLYGTALNAKGDYEKARVYLLAKMEKVSSIKESSKVEREAFNYRGTMLYELGFGHMKEQNWEEAIYYTNKSIEVLSEVKDSITLVNAYNLSGVILKRAGQPEQAIEHYKKALELSAIHGYNPLGRIILQNIASLYTDMDCFDKALEFSRKIFNYFPIADSLSLVHRTEYIHTLCTVGTILSNCQLHENAVDTMQLAVSKITPHTPAGLKFLAYSIWGRTNSEVDRIDKAKEAFDSAFVYLPYTKNLSNIAKLHLVYATHLWKKEHQYKAAELHFGKAYEQIEDLSQIGKLSILKNMLLFYEETRKDYTKAFKYAMELHERYVAEQSERYKKRIASFEVEFKTREKELEMDALQQIRSQEQADYRLKTIVASLFFVLCIVTIFLLFVLLRKKKLTYALNELKLQQIIEQEAKQYEDMLLEMNIKMHEQYLNGLESSNQHMAKELHDGVCNQLLSLELVYANDNPKLTQAIHTIRNEARLISHGLAIPEFSVISLQQTIQSLLDKLNSLEQLEFEFYFDKELEHVKLSHIQQREIYRIIQEALSNILKHSKASKVYITLSKQESKLLVVVEDDGKGFDSTKVGNGGFGLHSMHERADNIQAELIIESQVGSGTVVTLSMKL